MLNTFFLKNAIVNLNNLFGIEQKENHIVFISNSNAKIQTDCASEEEAKQFLEDIKDRIVEANSLEMKKG